MTRFAMSRRRRFVWFILCLLFAAILILLDHNFVPNKKLLGHEGKNLSGSITSDFEKYHEKTFMVINVVDGDTIDINIPDGQYKHTRIRLWGVDTPETKSEKIGEMYFGSQAAEFTNRVVLNKHVCLYLEKHRTRGKYGRLLAYLQIPDSRFLNEVLLAEGYAYADLRFKHSFFNKYKQLQAAARSKKRGLWQNVKKNQLPQWLQRIKPNLLKNQAR